MRQSKRSRVVLDCCTAGLSERSTPDPRSVHLIASASWRSKVILECIMLNINVAPASWIFQQIPHHGSRLPWLQKCMSVGCLNRKDKAPPKRVKGHTTLSEPPAPSTENSVDLSEVFLYLCKLCCTGQAHDRGHACCVRMCDMLNSNQCPQLCRGGFQVLVLMHIQIQRY